ncbi:RNA polymerase III subunit Rpc25 [Pseudomassariella vexata]|uniref:DNA-directed RNA polymerase subunit n=1 Tax=Pseudomassariella vexata TaxID=1141098 RepID=A0A1Y2DSU8_9PEZI|nr:RNA polymerase III subunit Rpc25 [Pseudomassariella vexata]ORY62239.1 RNA polymerase III subunit Rpc25 [Pseudomassariella vexata]
MFILTKISDLVQVTPGDFEKKSRQAIEDNINAKYSNRVIQKIGLCICMYDLIWASEGLIGHGTGLVNINVEFRLLVFRPFKGETIVGKISSATPEGIHIRTDFFEEIFVHFKELPESTEFDHNQKVWTWNMEEGEDRIFYDKNEMVRLQVIDEVWHDQAPDSTADDAAEKAKKISPYNVRGTMMKEGLGVCLWWDG